MFVCFFLIFTIFLHANPIDMRRHLLSVNKMRISAEVLFVLVSLQSVCKIILMAISFEKQALG